MLGVVGEAWVRGCLTRWRLYEMGWLGGFIWVPGWGDGAVISYTPGQRGEYKGGSAEMGVHDGLIRV